MSDAIEAYLDDLGAALHRDGAAHRRLLAETEDHLRESANRLRAQGFRPEEAEAEAVRRFGPAPAVAQQFRPSSGALMADLVWAGWLIASVGLVAIGLSGLLAWLIDATVGSGFLAGDSFGASYTPARCAEYLTYVPEAASCAAAAAVHHSSEVVFYRLDAGLVGLVVLAAYVVAARRLRRRGGVLPRGVTPLVAAALFGAVGLLLGLDAAGTWIGETTHHETVAGVGASLSAGVVALVVSGVAVIIGFRDLRRRPVRSPG